MTNLSDLEKKINSELTTKVKSTKINHKHICINIENENLLEVVLFLKNNNEVKFKQLIDITAVDYPESERRFKLVYLFLSHEFNSRVLIDFFINENEIVSSLTSIPRTALITIPNISLSITSDSYEQPIRLAIIPEDSETLLHPARAAMTIDIPFS